MRRYGKLVFVILFVFFAFFMSFQVVRSFCYNRTTVSITYGMEQDDRFQLFYDNDTQEHFSEEFSIWIPAPGGASPKTVEAEVMLRTLNALRLDVGEGENGAVRLYAITLDNFYGHLTLSADELAERFQTENIYNLSVGDGYLELRMDSSDPYLYAETFDAELAMKWPFLLAVSLITGALVLTLTALYRFTSIRNFVRELIINRSLIMNLARNDFKTKYAGSYLGIVWAFIQPVVTVLVYTFVFTVGMRSGEMEGVPFVNWLCAGILPWYFFSDALVNGSNTLVEYSYLVKKVVFNINILALVKVISSLFVHLVFAVIVMALFLITGFTPDIYWLQMIYYCTCTFFLALGLSYLCSAILLFFKDLGQIINVVLQVGVWMTPIMWQSNIIPTRFLWIFKLNPMFYIVQGYRNSFIHKVWFWENFAWTMGFWAALIGINFVGMLVFKKLKPHFADVI